MGQPLALVIDRERPLFREAIERAEQAGLLVIGLQNTEEALDVLWDQGDDVGLLMTDVADPGELASLRMIVDDWEDLNVLVVSERVDPPVDLPDRIIFMPSRLPDDLNEPGVAQA